MEREQPPQIDVAYDEPLPEPPELIAVPRGGGLPPTAVWAASPRLSLAWKVQWLALDQLRQGRSDGKDLYDAVLLAELDGMRLSPRLKHEIRSRLPERDILRPDTVHGWTIDTAGLPGDPAVWLDRLAAALEADPL